MNNLVATWRQPAVIDVRDEADVCELLARVHDRLAEIPELARALRLVDVALDEVLTWFDGGVVSLPVAGLTRRSG
ncbi:MAG: hypothetical protein QOJ23_2864 [Actinomycetota bacterium]|jgi:hypothetical protein|nr:hypothetical protein [Actinomycetota bacterium]MDQ1565844.1 hypothetical protein [Actinomycetota bacterium]